MIKVLKIKPQQKEFKIYGRKFTVESRARSNMTVWTLHKRFRPKPVDYRVLSDVDDNVPVAVQRLDEIA